MMKKSINDICISSSCFCMLILLAKIVINDCECTNGEAFLKSGNCISNCDDNELFQDKSCIPISKKEEDITNMFNKIVSYYKSIAPNTYGNKIMIEGEGINYIITTSSLESSNRNNNGDSYLLNLSEDCINSINEVASNYFIVLINIINTNYITTTNGIRIFNNNDKFVLSGLCNKQVFNIGIPVEVTNKEISLYKNIKNSNGYEIFNIYDSFYTDKCTKFTSEYNTDLSLQKRNEIYGIYSKEVCSDFCTYQKFNETELKIYCKCIYGEEHKRVEIETGGFNIKVIKCISKIGKGFMKNYMFFIVSILCFLFIVCFIISCISLSGTISGYVKEFEELKIKFLNYYKLEEKKEVKGKRKKGNKKKGAIKKEEKEKNDDIYEEENEDDNEDEGEEEEEEEEEGLDESNETYVNKKNDINNNQNNINNMNNPYFNFYMNNSAFNPYIQYHQYQQYQIQMYNQYIDYLRNINNNYNNNEKEERENEEEEEDEEDIKENNERKKRYRYNFFPQFKKIDKNAVYTLKLDYDKVKEYSRMMKQNKEKPEGSKKQEEETKKENKLKLNKIKKKEDKKDNKKNKHKDKDKENENKSKLKNESKNKKDVKKIKKQDEDMNENNHIDIFKKKVEHNNNKDFINNKNLKKNDIENEKKKKHKSKNKDKDLKHLLKNQKEKIEKKVNDGNIIQKHATDKNNNINIKRKDKKASKTAKIDKLDLNMNYKNKNDKPNPPKNSNASERELISPEIKSNDDLKIINCEKEEMEKNEKEENKNEEEEEGEEEEDDDDNENDENGGEKNDDEENDENGGEKNDDEENDESGVEKIDNEKKDEEDDKEKNDDENLEEKKEEIDEKEEKKSDINDRMQDNKEIKDKNKEEEKEQKILKLNLNSNGENSTLSNIINNSKKNDAEKISVQKPMSNSTKIEDKSKFEIKFGSVEFYKMLNKIPEAKRIDFFNSSELNYMEYKYTCDYDERTFFKIYFSMIKEENNIIYSISFCTSDYNLSLIKFSFLIIQIILYLTVSVLFFTDDTIDNIFDKQNKFDIRYMILPMVFTFLICFLICMILKALIKTNNNVIDIKYEIQTYEEGLYTIRLKLIFYFFIGFIISACGWILISSWSSVFTNSQIKVIEFAGFTLGAHFILQIIYCLLITSLRICSLNSESKNNSCLYNFSKILTYF